MQQRFSLQILLLAQHVSGTTSSGAQEYYTVVAACGISCCGFQVQEVGCGRTDWIELAQDTDRWEALVNAVMNLRVP